MCRYMRRINKMQAMRGYWGMIEEEMIIYSAGIVLREMCILQWS